MEEEEEDEEDEDEKKVFLWLIAGHLSLSPGNCKNFFVVAR